MAWRQAKPFGLACRSLGIASVLGPPTKETNCAPRMSSSSSSRRRNFEREPDSLQRGSLVG